MIRFICINIAQKIKIISKLLTKAYEKISPEILYRLLHIQYHYHNGVCMAGYELTCMQGYELTWVRLDQAP